MGVDQEVRGPKTQVLQGTEALQGRSRSCDSLP